MRPRKTPNLGRSENPLYGADNGRKGRLGAIATICNAIGFRGVKLVAPGLFGPVGAANSKPIEAYPVSLAANAFTGDQRDELLIPFEDHRDVQVIDPETRRTITVDQRFNAEAANAIVADLNTMRGKFALAMNMIPFYIGHPDHPLFAHMFSDWASYGWLKSARVSDQGLHLGVKWNADGEALVANGKFKFYSPHWLLALRKVGGKFAEGYPVRIKSMGLINDPNMNVPMIAAANAQLPVPDPQDPANGDQTMIDRILAVIGLDRIKTLDDAVAWIAQAKAAILMISAAVDQRWKAESAVSAAANAATTPEAKLIVLLDEACAARDAALGKVATLEANAAAANAQLGQLTSEIGAARTSLTEETASRQRVETELADLKGKHASAVALAANVRKAAAAHLIDRGIRDGSIIAGERAKWETDFEKDFDAAVTAAANAKPVMNTESKTKNLAFRKQGAGGPAQQFSALVVEKQKELGGGKVDPKHYDQAFALCANAHPELIAAMHQPQRDFTTPKAP